MGKVLWCVRGDGGPLMPLDALAEGETVDNVVLEECRPAEPPERGLTVDAVDQWRASLNKPGVGDLTEPQTRQLVSLVLASDKTVAAIAKFADAEAA